MRKSLVLFILSIFIFATSSAYAQEQTSPTTSNVPTLGMLPVIGILGDSLLTPQYAIYRISSYIRD
jgi:hypothetical protein